MSARVLSAGTIVLLLYQIILAIFYVRPRAISRPGEGFHMWKWLLLSTFVPLAIAIYTFISIPTLSYTRYMVLLIESIMLSLITSSIFYLRPRSISIIYYGKWKLFLMLSLIGMVCGFLLLIVEDF
jgi:hypothetical protein